MSAQDKKGIAILSAGLLMLAAIAVFALKVVNSPERDYDPVTLCNEQIPRDTHHLLLIDVSDALSAHQAHFLRSHISRVLSSAGVNDRFSIFVLDEKTRGLSDPIVDLCKPKSEDDINGLTANRYFVQHLYRERFEQPLETAIATAVGGDGQAVSPIYEALSDIASFGWIDPRAEKIKLAIFSDMLQNSQLASVFRSGASAIERLPKIDLQRVQTKVFWLDRDQYSQYQTNALESRWRDYLAGVSRLDEIEKIRN